MPPDWTAAADCYPWADCLLSAGGVCLLLDDAPGARRHLQAGLAAARQHALHSVEIDLLGQLSIAEEGCGDLAAALASVRALRRAGQWPDVGAGAMRVSVNVSPVQLADPDLVETLVAAAGGCTAWIALELTESVQLAEDATTQQRMRQLREAGFSLVIDDFGAGDSSFSYLNRAYFDRLKIDRALVQGSTLGGDRFAVLDSIVLMAHRLGLGVVAEGIETAAQADGLAEQGCDCLQGHGIARPMPLAALLRWPPVWRQAHTGPAAAAELLPLR